LSRSRLPHAPHAGGIDARSPSNGEAVRLIDGTDAKDIAGDAGGESPVAPHGGVAAKSLVV